MAEIVRITNPSAFSLADYEALVAQVPRFSMRGQPLLEYMSKMAKLGELHALVDEGVLRGLIGFYANDAVNHKAYLSLIVIDHSLRGKGCGTMLFDIMLDACHWNGMQSISLNVVSDNKTAMAFYRRNGFVVTGPGRDEYHVVMTSKI